MSLDDVLRFGGTIGIYFVIFAVIGVIFYEVDKRFKAWAARPARCAACNAELDPAAPSGRAVRCPSCGGRRRTKRRR